MLENDELKKKIAEIIESEFENRCRKTNCQNCDLYPYEMCQPNMYADALIAAGIGDVKEAEHRAEVAERALKNACVRLNSDDGVLCSYEMGFGWFCPHIKASCEECYVEWFIKQAEKELAEEGK